MKIKTSILKSIYVSSNNEGQRIDNFLKSHFRNVPKSLIYRFLRKKRIKVNNLSIKPYYKLRANDKINVPSIRNSHTRYNSLSSKLNKIAILEKHILYEDEVIIIHNKPSGIAVHGGSGLRFGIIEAFRIIRSNEKSLFLVHRLDRETSGILLIAKKRSVLLSLHEQLRNREIQKYYIALVRGCWPDNLSVIRAPLVKNISVSGIRMTKISRIGKPSETVFKVVKRYHNATLMKVIPITGRMHQIRVHALHAGYPIALDNRYGDNIFNAYMKSIGLRRLFLHARIISFKHPKSGKNMYIQAPLDEELKIVLKKLNSSDMKI